MKEIEEAERKKARIRAVLNCGVIAENSYEKEIAALTSMFPTTPHRILEGVPGEKEWDPEQIPINRKRRRQISKAKRIIIDMFSGNHEQRWKRLETMDTVVVSIDILKGLNVMDPHVSGWIDSLIDTGKVVLWMSGPPCRSVSACRQRGEEDGGPQPLRGRNGEARYGLPGLTARQQALADHDATLWVKNARWAMKVKERREDADILVEQPADPSEWKSGAEEYPTFLNWEETKVMEKVTGARRITLDQGAVGHQARKPTTILTTLKDLEELQGLKSEVPGMAWANQVEHRINQSKSLASWAPGLVEAIIQAVLRRPQEAKQVKTLRRKEKDETAMWESHFMANHVPFRRDCMLCVESMGKDRQRRKQSHASLHTMSLDMAGPFDQGFDQEVNKPRYLLLATVTVPILSDQELPHGLPKLHHPVRPREDVPVVDEGQELQEEEAVAGEEAEQYLAVQGEDVEELTNVEMNQIEEANQKWKTFITQVKQDEAEVKAITWGVPLESRATKHVIGAVTKIYSRFRALQIPILRVHCDRAREFTSASFKSWVEGRSMQITFSAGDEPTGNARIEREIGVIKGRTRVLLKSSQAPTGWWPLAARHALEERCRQQLWSLGIKTPEILPFGSVAVAKRKTWENRSQPWKWPFQKVRCWGPAADMSLTSRGHFLQTSDGKFIRSTVVIVPTQTATSMEDLQNRSRGDLQADQEKADPVNLAPGNAEDATWDGGRLEQSFQEVSGAEVAIADHEGEEGLQFDRIPEGDVVIEDVPKRDTFVVQPHDVPRFRIKNKKSPQQIDVQEQQWLSLRRVQLQERGEWSATWSQEDEERVHQLRVMQHLEMRKMIAEEMSRVQGGEQVLKEELEIVEHTVKEAGELERQLEEDDRKKETRKVRSLTKKVEEEVLQTRLVPLDEVRRNPEDWMEAFKKEYDTLTSGPVVPITEADVEKMKQEGLEIEMLPMKAIASKKPPARHKGRVVVCGNYSQQKEDENVSVGGACSIAIRSVIHTAALRSWTIGSIDVSGAFLQAPRRPRTKVTLTEPPMLLKDLGLAKRDEVWKIECALYGLTESPGDWSVFRDTGLKEIQWSHGGESFRLKETPEPNIWKICTIEGEMRGVIAVYVDDFLVAMEKEGIGAVFEAIKKKWVCSEEEMVEEEKPMRFCGFEIQKRREGGFWIGQSGYLKDLLKKRGVQGTEKYPCPAIKEGPDEEEQQLQDIRSAQTIVGEVMWLAGRSRPDICYTTGVLSRLLHRRPKYACELGEHLLRYLNGTQDKKLEYVKSLDQRKRVEGCETFQRDKETVQILADVSFSPSHEQHRSIQGVCIEHNSNVLFWESVRQPFVALSTCESELIGYVEGHQAGEGICGLLQVLEHTIKERHILGDNKAAIAVCVNETGAWRTRHLRIRSHRLREILQQENPTWKAIHLRGTSLSADGLTKPLQHQPFQKFVELIGMGEDQREVEAAVRKVQVAQGSGSRPRNKAAVMAVAGGLLLSSELQWLGAILILCASLTKWREEKEPLANQDTQDRKKTPNKKWERGCDENGLDRSGTVTPVVSAGACTLQGNKNEKEKQDRSFQPGIRAFRLSPEPKSSSSSSGVREREPWYWRWSCKIVDRVYSKTERKGGFWKRGIQGCEVRGIRGSAD